MDLNNVMCGGDACTYLGCVVKQSYLDQARELCDG